MRDSTLLWVGLGVVAVMVLGKRSVSPAHSSCPPDSFPNYGIGISAVDRTQLPGYVPPPPLPQWAMGIDWIGGRGPRLFNNVWVDENCVPLPLTLPVTPSTIQFTTPMGIL